MLDATAENPTVRPEIAEAWQKLQAAAQYFDDAVKAAQQWCPHTQAVEYHPRYFSFKKPDCQEYPKRRCVCCGLTETAQRQLDPDSFSELDAMNGAEIVQVFDQGYLFNHYIMPKMPNSDRLEGKPLPID